MEEINQRTQRDKRDKRKVVRSVVQILILAALLVALTFALFWQKPYRPTSESTRRGGDYGFISIAYFGVNYVGDETLISQERLREHLIALKDSGYVTITQQDVLDYYRLGKDLPEKALFLFFEDGRRDTAVLSQRILEQCNFKASMLSYANNLDSRNFQFLSASDLRKLQRGSFWELGTNGYRLSYINIFDRHGNYLGEMTPDDYGKVSSYIKREYNHYLMDYIRDKHDIPMESYQQMQERIANDYRMMKSIYEEEFGQLPRLYALMHANTGQYATNNRVSVENEIWIGELFAMNFNREMYCHNDRGSNIYDLTRMQPQAYWSRNHLLMRIWGDTGQDMAFMTGDEQIAANWTLIAGAAEYADDKIYLTSLPESVGVVRLNDSNQYSDVHVSTYFNGNILGTQAIDLRANEDLSQYIAVEIKNNRLYVYEKRPNEGNNELFTLSLDQFDNVIYQTWEENRQEALDVEIDAKLSQQYQADESQAIALELLRSKEKADDINTGLYVPGIDLKDAGSRYLEIWLQGNLLTVAIDNRIAVENLDVGIAENGYVCLRSAWGGYGFSQRNLADDVYDGVFQSLVVKGNTGKGVDNENILFDNSIYGLRHTVIQAEQVWKKITGWLLNIL